MVMDYSSYADPGITIEETNPPIMQNTLGLGPTVVALIGETQGYRTFTEVVQLNAENTVELNKRGIDTSTVNVVDRFSGEEYQEDIHYALETTSGEDAEVGTADDVTTIQRIADVIEPDEPIADGGFVTVTYQFTDDEFTDPVRVTDADSVFELFGRMYDDDGNINSPLSLASWLAFINDASIIVAVPVIASDGVSVTNEDWQDAFNRLQNEDAVDAVVPLTTQSAIHDMTLTHVRSMKSVGGYRRAFIGGTEGRSELIAKANGYSDSRVSVVGPSRYRLWNQRTDALMTVNAQYAAAAVAGAFGSRQVFEPLTRKTISGLSRVSDKLTEQQMFQLQRNGVLVLWQQRNGRIVVRHGLTTNMQNVYTQEISIHASRDRLQQVLHEMLQQQGLIGSAMVADTGEYVKSAVIGALEFAQEENLIYDYSDVKLRIPSSRPTVLQVRFMYKPTMPLNYIHVQFALDTQVGDLEFTDLGEFEAVA